MAVQFISTSDRDPVQAINVLFNLTYLALLIINSLEITTMSVYSDATFYAKRIFT